jgi:hypothetical protein
MAGVRFLAFVAVTVVGCAGARMIPTTPAAPPEPVQPSAPMAMAAPLPAEVAASTSATEAPAAAPDPPTWETIYSRYFGPGTVGGCGRGRKCHAEAMADAPSAYAWLKQRGYIAGTQSPLVSRTNSCLRWFGGNMPPRGAPNDEAIRDLGAWVAGGAPDK